MVMSGESVTAAPAVVELAAFTAASAPLVARGEPLTMRVGHEHTQISGELAKRMIELLTMVAAGQPVDITGLPEVLTTGQAADLLHVSRPTVIAMIDRGELACSRVGAHRRVRTIDVLALRDGGVQSRRREALDNLTRLSQELGLYD